MFLPIECKPEGLFYSENYLTLEDHDFLFSLLKDKNFCWDNQPQRREVKQYGQIYNYRKQNFEEMFEEIPDWLTPYTKKLQLDGVFTDEPNQIIINKYRQTGNRNWSIPPHIDSPVLFGKSIASISLGHSCVVEFCKAHHGEDPEIIDKLTISPCSLYYMTGPSRYDYYHRIPDKKYNSQIDPLSEKNVRISLTFRNVISSNPLD